MLRQYTEEDEQAAAENLIDIVFHANSTPSSPKEVETAGMVCRSLYLILESVSEFVGDIPPAVYEVIANACSDMLLVNAVLEYEPDDALKMMDSTIEILQKTRQNLKESM